jgi:hypothetical protein
MSRASAVIAFWALLLAAIAVVGWAIFFHSSAPEAWLFLALPGFAVLTTLAVAACSWISRDDARDPGAPLVLDDLSFPAALAGIAIVAVLLGLAVGAWLWMIGAALALAGGSGVVRELRAQRKRQRAGEGAGGEPDR